LHGNSQINLALKARDYKSFYLLMDSMIEFQNCIENSFIINDWLISAIKKGIDIEKLLDSEICSTKLNKDNLEHPETWPTYYDNDM
jgi:hypothetical protein